MVGIGYTLLTEQSGPRSLVEHSASAERAGFDFEVISDHTFPWLTPQGHSPYAWSVLGAVAQVTSDVELMTYVTAPTMRYHPAVVAQKAATVGLLSRDRFLLGLGAGENLNEHLLGRGWPPVNVRHEMLSEALEIISGLFDGGSLDYLGRHYRVDSAKLWDLPDRRVPIGTAVSGSQSVRRFAPAADAMIAVEPQESFCREWDQSSGGSGDRKIGQLPICWDPDRAAATERAHEQFSWFAGGWKVNSELPSPQSFAAATQYVRPEDVAAAIPCGPDVEPIVKSVSAFWQAGFTDVALVQVGVDKDPAGFFAFASNELLPALRSAAP
ncbi:MULTISPECIES: TIGR03557 family F420-dependent LLM class oxidoreductase [unclassified Actinopolyspora]|uniref:TIGR03557 family F420-dependent LLM class oxidoreductase n=1 Tax=Actinopolyspora TaxID=1849 RepID=UPI0013F63D48|nr:MULTISPECIES: TIGR03557 family F420-dependent LLM class oxidoreductase [unclassified Actinopolyspora]NHD19493.1 TIGR03557 family F420-dependent LLM class oxidoreductase [Actinopolyspora sp. BKK2]NHE77433.1 TIGR03557 family F420-dependent LLM class oxidoreductase [Actinopolyspora sp. BKK1]